jgi:hypothetical protein
MSQKYAKSSNVQTYHQPYFQAFVRHTPVRNWQRYSNRGHKDVKTTMIYTHVLNRGGRGVKSPVDSL